MSVGACGIAKDGVGNGLHITFPRVSLLLRMKETGVSSCSERASKTHAQKHSSCPHFLSIAKLKVLQNLLSCGRLWKRPILNTPGKDFVSEAMPFWCSVVCWSTDLGREDIFRMPYSIQLQRMKSISSPQR